MAGISPNNSRLTNGRDPSVNVRELTEAANQRQDDLREAAGRLNDAKLAELRTVIGLNTSYSEKLAAAESRRVNEQLALRAAYEERLTAAEAKRIDAIRAVDVNAVAVASQRAADQALVLANTVTQSAEAVRNLVAATATQTNQAVAAANSSLSQRITTLEQAQYEGKGKSALADPRMEELLKRVESISEARTSGAGAAGGRIQLTGLIFGAAGFIAVVLGAITFFSRPAPTPAPIVIERIVPPTP